MDNCIIKNHVKIEVLNAGLIHVEQAMNNQFRTEPTLFASTRKSDFQDFTVVENDERLVITTGKMKLTYLHRYPKIRDQIIFVEQPDGSRWDMWDEDQQNLGGTIDSLDGCKAPRRLPDGLLSRAGIFCVDNRRQPLVVEGKLLPRTEDDDYQDYYIFCYGKDYVSALQSLTWLSGEVPMLPRFMLGSWYSRWFYYTSEDYRNIVREYREHDIPLDILVFDMEWHDRKAVDGMGWAMTLGWTGWTYNRELLPDAEKLLQELKDDDIHIAFNTHPHDGIRKHEIMYGDFMKALGKEADGTPMPFDVNNPAYMDAYFKYAHEPREKEGVDVWWVDWQQDVLMPWIKGLPGVRHLPWINYQYYHHMEQNGRRGVSLSRWGGWGDQKHPIHFSGDTSAKWCVLEYEIPFTATAGNCGCFYWSHDMGGFCGDRNGELYARWLQFGAVSATMRLHSCGEELDRRPWKWEPEIYESLRRSFMLRGELMPYIYTMVYRAHRDSLPLIRPVYLQHAEDDKAYINPQEYFFGDHLLAAPVTSPGCGDNKIAFQRVYLPEGEFYNYFTGEKLTAGEHLVAASLNEFPLYVRAGVPLPLGKAGKNLTSLQKEITIQIFPAEGEYQFELYDDDGISRESDFAITVIHYSRKGNVHTVSLELPEGAFAPQLADRSYRVKIRNLRNAESFSIRPGETKSIEAEEIPQEEIRAAAIQAWSAGLSEIDQLKLRGCGEMTFHEDLEQKHAVRKFYSGEISSCEVKLFNGEDCVAIYEVLQPHAVLYLPLEGRIEVRCKESRTAWQTCLCNFEAGSRY